MSVERWLAAAGLAGAVLCAHSMSFLGCGGSNSAGIPDASSDATKTGSSSSSGSASSGSSGSASSGGGSGSGMCLALGSRCAVGGDCCSGVCTGGVCNYPMCTSDGQACSTNAQCCSQNCASGMCSPLNPQCKTLGNACTGGGECCSGLCAGGSCQPSSFCTQPGDTCTADADCCTGQCMKDDAGQSAGTCATSAPHGPANCGLVDGQLCSGDGADGGVIYVDGGLPACGGACCSRACAPWGPTGVLVCQPASGCHIVGDLCTKDGDCCGSEGLPGGSHKPVTCVIDPGAKVGVCRNPMGCKPDGDVCKLKTMSCNASCDCCSGNCEVDDTCHQDNVGVPRCAGPCVDAGGACASSANCCNGAPCVPNPGGMPPFVCSSTPCIGACGACTNNADCCPGTSCNIAPGTTNGTCGPCGSSSSGSSSSGSGSSGSSSGSDAAPPPPPPTMDAGCAFFGQICTTSADCCNALQCVNGRCQSPIH